MQNNTTRGFGLLETILSKKRAKITANLIGEQARKGRILDIGCGFFPYFLKSIKFKEKHGLDFYINRKLFDHEGILLKEVNLEEEKLPYKDNYFDVVTMLAVFEHISKENLKPLLNEIYRILKKDGVFIMTTPAPWSVPLLWLLSRIKIISKVEIDDHKNSFTIAKIIEFIKSSGFKKEKIKNGFFEFYLNMWIRIEK